MFERLPRPYTNRGADRAVLRECGESPLAKQRAPQSTELSFLHTRPACHRSVIVLVMRIDSSGETLRCAPQSRSGKDWRGYRHGENSLQRPSSSRSADRFGTSVPAVSMMSSMKHEPCGSSGHRRSRCMTSAWYSAAVRRLSTMAKPAASRLAMARARSTPPASGATMVRSGRSPSGSNRFEEHRCREQR